jgi:hypothetical protein
MFSRPAPFDYWFMQETFLLRLGPEISDLEGFALDWRGGLDWPFIRLDLILFQVGRFIL